MDRAFARVGLRLHVGPSAFGNALGSSIAAGLSDDTTLATRIRNGDDPFETPEGRRALAQSAQRLKDLSTREIAPITAEELALPALNFEIPSISVNAPADREIVTGSRVPTLGHAFQTMYGVAGSPDDLIRFAKYNYLSNPNQVSHDRLLVGPDDIAALNSIPVSRGEQQGYAAEARWEQGRRAWVARQSDPNTVLTSDGLTVGDIQFMGSVFETAAQEDAKRIFNSGLKPAAGYINSNSTIRALEKPGFLASVAATVIGEPAAFLRQAWGDLPINPISGNVENFATPDRKMMAIAGLTPIYELKALRGLSLFRGAGVNNVISTSSSGQLAELLPLSSLSSRQISVHEQLSAQGVVGTFAKKGVSMADLRAIGRVTGDEYSMFTLGAQRTVIRGYGNEISVSKNMLDDLVAGNYGKWSGHTHPPGYSINPGPADRPFLQQMGQQRSAIWGDQGHFIYGRLPSDDAMIHSQIMRAQWARIYGGD